ncbi:MAG: HesB/IscA family protein [Acidiferrobacterales bacterium]
MSEATTVAYSTEVTETDVKLTPVAEHKMAELLGSAESEVQGIRVFVAGGGCGGMTYGMTYAVDISAYDSTLEGNGYKLVVDAVALNFLQGCEIDFAQDSFVFNNVFRAVGGSGTCGGCGGGGGF